MQSSYKHRNGDRKDGRLLRTLPAINVFMPHIMPKKSSGLIYYDESYDVTAADKCLRTERVAGYKGMGYMHFIIAAYIRCISMLPGMNRFVAGRKIFARNTVTVALTVRRSLNIDGTESVVKVEFEPTDTIFDVYRKINEKLEEVRTGTDINTVEDFMSIGARFPRFMLKFIMWILSILDYFGRLPAQIAEGSPYHASLMITDTSTMKIRPVYHNIPEFGNIPLYYTFGAKRTVYEPDKHGNLTGRKYVDTKLVIDGRITDDHYYAQFLQAMRYIFAHPEILEKTPTRVIEDVG